MRKIAFLALLFSLILGLSVTASYAEAPGCDDGKGAPNMAGPAAPDSFRDMQKNHADAMRVRDRAIAKQIVKRNDSSLGLTCMDQAMKLTSRLGYMFSDNVETPPVAPMGQVAFPDFGSGNLLAADLNVVVSPELKQMLEFNFMDSLARMIYSWDAMSLLMGFVQPYIDLITGYFSGTLFPGLCGGIALIDILKWAMDFLGIAMPAFITAAIAAINAAKAALMAFINAIMLALKAAIDALLASIRLLIGGCAYLPPYCVNLGSFFSSFGSLSTLQRYAGMCGIKMAGLPMGNFCTPGIGIACGGAKVMDCNKLQKLWNDGDPGGGVASVEGNGIERGLPYLDLLTVVTNPPPAAMGAAYKKEISTLTDTTILDRAYTDLTTKLNAPGLVPSWPKPPTFAPNANTTYIIGCISSGAC